VKSCNEILDTIISRFPKHRETIRELYEESNSFHSLCEDYYDCRLVLYESIKNCNKSSDLQKEYQVMLSEIEVEILERIIN